MRFNCSRAQSWPAIDDVLSWVMVFYSLSEMLVNGLCSTDSQRGDETDRERSTVQIKRMQITDACRFGDF